jgi:hypothetical protein
LSYARNFIELEVASPFSQILPLVSSPRQINPAHVLRSYLRYIFTSASHLRLGLRKGPFPSGFPTKELCEFPFSPMCATCPAHFILLGFDCQNNS